MGVMGATGAGNLAGSRSPRRWSARVGGAHIAELVEAATGLSMWAEWAKVELAGADGGYRPPVAKQDYAALLISLSRQQHPDTSAYQDAEIVWRLVQNHHAGLLLKSPSAAHIRELLSAYERRFTEDLYAYQPPRDKPVTRRSDATVLLIMQHVCCILEI